jgi:hypothetical protein
MLQPPGMGDQVPGPGAEAFAVLIGLMVTISVFALGLGYWIWRRQRGPLHRADDDVRALAGSDSGLSAREAPGEHRATDRQQRREGYGSGFPSHRPGASDTRR